MASGLRKAVGVSMAVPLMGLVLAGCGDSSSGTTAEQIAPAPTASASDESGSESESVTPTETQRYDINLIMVCDVVESTLTELGAEPTVQKARSALRKSLTAAFESSTTPDATLRDVKVDNMLNEGCPAARSKALTVTDLDAISKLAR